VKLQADRIERLKLERELDVARRIQMGVLPQTLPTCPGYELASFSEPAEQTGGDIFDVVPLPAYYKTFEMPFVNRRFFHHPHLYRLAKSRSITTKCVELWKF
jgi:hypothetical protein